MNKVNLFYCQPNRKHRIFSNKKNDDSTIQSIGNISQVSLPFIPKKTVHPWTYQDDYDFLKDQQRFFKLPDDNNSPYINRKQAAIKLLQQVDLNSVADVEERFSFVLKYLKQAKIGNLYNITVLIYTFILSKLSDFQKAINVWQKYLVFCNSARGFKYKIIAYKHIAELFLSQNSFAKALVYSKKLLKYSLYFNEGNYELNAYELIGKIYYYIKQSDYAKAFHEKFLDGKRLLEQDPNRLQAIRMLDFQIRQRQKAGTIDTDSDEEFELEKIVDPKELVQVPIRLKEVLINKKNLWLHVKRMSEPLGPINERVIDQKLFQREFYTQLSNNSSVKNFMINNPLPIKRNIAHKVIDKLIYDIQQF